MGQQDAEEQRCSSYFMVPKEFNLPGFAEALTHNKSP